MEISLLIKKSHHAIHSLNHLTNKVLQISARDWIIRQKSDRNAIKITDCLFTQNWLIWSAALCVRQSAIFRINMM